MTALIDNLLDKVAARDKRIKHLEKSMRETMAGLAETHCSSHAEIEVETVWSDNASWYAYYQLKKALEEGL